MKDTYLEITYRKGRPLAAYLYLNKWETGKSFETKKVGEGLIMDYDETGWPIGLEITSPRTVSITKINEVLKKLNVAPVSEEELLPLKAA